MWGWATHYSDLLAAKLRLEVQVKSPSPLFCIPDTGHVPVNILKIYFSARYRCPPLISSTLTQKPHGPWYFIKAELFMLKGIFLLFDMNAVSSGSWNISVICSVPINTSLSQTKICSAL